MCDFWIRLTCKQKLFLHRNASTVRFFQTVNISVYMSATQSEIVDNIRNISWQRAIRIVNARFLALTNGMLRSPQTKWTPLLLPLTMNGRVELTIWANEWVISSLHDNKFPCGWRMVTFSVVSYLFAKPTENSHKRATAQRCHQATEKKYFRGFFV